MQNQMLQDYNNRKPVAGISANDTSYLASQQFLSNIELNQAIAAGDQDKINVKMMELGLETAGSVTNEHNNPRFEHMKIDFDFHQAQAEL